MLGTVSRRAVLPAISAGMTLPPLVKARATLRVGQLLGMSGPSAGITGPGSVVAVKLAAQEYQASRADFDADINAAVADFQAKSDIALNITCSWTEQQSVNTTGAFPLSVAPVRTITLLQQFDNVGLAIESGPSVLAGSASWDYCKPVKTVSGGDVTWSFNAGDCPTAKS